MKRLMFIAASIVVLVYSSSLAQTVTIAPQTAYPCGSVSFPVVAGGFTSNVGAITMFIKIDTLVLDYTGHTPGTISFYQCDLEHDSVVIAWSNAGGVNINGTMITLHFTYKGGNSLLDFLPGCEFTRAVPIGPITVDYSDGSIAPIPKTTYYVDGAVAASGTGLSWASPLKTITEATNKPLTPGDEVLITPYTYNEALVIKTNGSEIVPVKYGVTLSDTNKITFPSGTDLSCVSPQSYPGKYYAYVFRSWKCNSGAYPILSVNDAQDYVIVDNSSFIPETGASGDTSLVQAAIGLPVIYKKFATNPETERVIVNSNGLTSNANCYFGTALGTGDSATAANYNIVDGFDLTGSVSKKTGLRIQSSSYNVFKNGRIYNLDTVGVYISGSSAKPAKYNIISDNKIYNTKRRALKVGKHSGLTSNSNYAWYTLIKGNEVYVQDDNNTTTDSLWNMVDVHKSTAFTVIEGNTFRSYSSKSAGKGTVEIWDNARKTMVSCNFFRDIGKLVTGTNAIIFIRNNSLNINVFNNVLLNSSLVNDDVYAFRINAQGHSNSNLAYNTVLNVDNGFYLDDSGTPAPVFRIQNNIMHINYLNSGVYFTNVGTTGRYTVSNNCYPSQPTIAGDPYHTETGRQVGDPQFVNPSFFSSAHGVQLKTGSICLGAGTPVTGISRDYARNARNATTPAIGAFESALTSMAWTGKINTDWHNYLNWSPELVPTSTIMAIIPVKSNMPVVSNANAVCKGLQLSTGASVAINNNRLLTVY